MQLPACAVESRTALTIDGLRSLPVVRAIRLLQVLQRIRQYMKEQNLPKDPRDGRKTILDAPLQGLFGVKTVTAININKYLSKHMKRWVDTPAEEEVRHVCVARSPCGKLPSRSRSYGLPGCVHAGGRR